LQHTENALHEVSLCIHRYTHTDSWSTEIKLLSQHRKKKPVENKSALGW